MMKNDIYFMKQAISRAKAAAKAGEVPIGAVLVKDGEIIASGRNMKENKKNALLHAELVAIDRGCKKLGAWRLEECSLYVTMEPCPMCAGAIINARIPRVVIAARDEKCGACGSVCDLFAMDFNHHPTAEYGLLEAESQALLQDFFRDLREKLKDRPKWKKPE